MAKSKTSEKTEQVIMLITCLLIMVTAAIQRDGFRNDVPKKLYADFPPGIHSMYIGEVIAAWRK